MKKALVTPAFLAIGCLYVGTLFISGQLPCSADDSATPAENRRDVAAVAPVVATPLQLSAEHLQAVNRRRRIIFNADIGGPPDFFGIDPQKFVDYRFQYADEPGSQIDSIWWCIDEGNLAYYPSKVLPVTDCPRMKKWFDAGIDIVKVMVDESHKRGLEAFYTYRINGLDREADVTTVYKLPMKVQHPDWLITEGLPSTWYGLWNFVVPEVRQYKVAILRELAENYDVDGIDIDFGRMLPYLPPGHAWEHRDTMTDFVRRVRMMLQDVAAQRKRPILLSVSVQPTLRGSHFDGLDVETWVRDGLVDLLVLGDRSIEPDIGAHRRICQGTPVKIYPRADDFHYTDGYPGTIEFFRGNAANWWRQGADGIATINFSCCTNDFVKTLFTARPGWPLPSPESQRAQQQFYHEVGDPEVIRFKNKFFAVERRLGPGGPIEYWAYYNATNIEGRLPTAIPQAPMPAILSLYVADDIAGNSDRLKQASVRLQLSGATASDVVQVKLNGVLLPAPKLVDGEWRIYAATARQFAVGENMLSIRASERATGAQAPISIEKCEIHVNWE